MAGNKENVEPIHQRNKEFLSLKGKSKDSWFTSVSEEELTVMAKKQIPKNMEKSRKWAITNLLEWYTNYNERNKDNTYPEEVITSNYSKELLNKWLCVYINETRSKGGEPYPPIPFNHFCQAFEA